MEGVLLRRPQVLLQCMTYPIPLAVGALSLFSQTDTKESKWDMPDELLLLLEKVEKEGKAAAQSVSALVYVFGSFFR